MRHDADLVPHCDAGGVCITCGDVAVAMRVRVVDEERGLALCEEPGGRRSSVETLLVEPVAVGEELLVHAGTAIARSGAGRDARATTP